MSSRTAWVRLIRPYSRCGVEITDSPYVVVNMKLMTRMGARALQRIESEGTFVKGLHSTGDLDPDRRFIMHFPDELTIKSIGSGYGGNALLGKKCHALRIASHPGTPGRLARRAYADRRTGEPTRRDPLHCLRISVGLRQDQSGDVDSAGVHARLESLDARRRHRLAAPGRRWSTACNQPGIWLLRCRTRHQ